MKVALVQSTARTDQKLQRQKSGFKKSKLMARHQASLATEELRAKL
jgi:hypothetical protein